jgi:hypothetical protein
MYRSKYAFEESWLRLHNSDYLHRLRPWKLSLGRARNSSCCSSTAKIPIFKSCEIFFKITLGKQTDPAIPMLKSAEAYFCNFLFRCSTTSLAWMMLGYQFHVLTEANIFSMHTFDPEFFCGCVHSLFENDSFEKVCPKTYCSNYVAFEQIIVFWNLIRFEFSSLKFGPNAFRFEQISGRTKIWSNKNLGTAAHGFRRPIPLSLSTSI